MFEKFRLGKRGENIIFTIFILIYVAYCLNSPDMSFESFKTVLTIGSVSYTHLTLPTKA